MWSSRFGRWAHALAGKSAIGGRSKAAVSPARPAVSHDVSRRAERILAQQLFAIRSQTDRIFALLFGVQWILAVGCAVTVSPSHDDRLLPLAGWATAVLASALSLVPVLLTVRYPGAALTRWLIAFAQMAYSALFIHLMPGSIVAHYHIFGSLALLALYRDCRLFVPVALLLVVDPLLRGMLLPQATLSPMPTLFWRFLEHAGWLFFAVGSLFWSCLIATRELSTIATTQAALEDANEAIERRVEERTYELQARTEQLEAESLRRQTVEAQLLQAQKLESIGQLAAGIAHEINTPMQFLSDNIEFLSDCSNRLFEVVDGYEKNLFGEGQNKSWTERKNELRQMMERNRFQTIRQQVPQAISESLDGIGRVIHIVRAMKEFSHPGNQQKLGVDLNNAVSSMVTITRNRWKYVAEMELDLDPDLPTLSCVPADINQVLMNLIVNAADAIAEKVGDQGDQKGQITIRTRSDGRNIVIEVEDTGCGIPAEIRNRIFDPFFTTKEVGHGTGQGLAICYNVVASKHSGTIDVISKPGEGTTFRVELPRTSSQSRDDADGEYSAESPAIPALAFAEREIV